MKMDQMCHVREGGAVRLTPGAPSWVNITLFAHMQGADLEVKGDDFRLEQIEFKVSGRQLHGQVWSFLGKSGLRYTIGNIRIKI